MTSHDAASADGASLEDLMSRFRALQHTSSATRLNDRSAVEIMQLLHAHGLLDAVYTTSGRGYVTRAQLRRDVCDELDAAGGRVNIVDLPNLLHVDMHHVERAVAELRASSPPDAFLEVGGEIITPQYVASLGNDVAGLLRERGSFTLTDFARRHQLPLQFATSIVEGVVAGGRVAAVAAGETYYTTAFVAGQRLRMLCALVGSQGQTPIAAVAQRHELLPALAAPMAASVARAELKAIGRVDGTGAFVPAHVEQCRAARLRSALQLNGFVTFEAAQADGAANAPLHLAAAFNPPAGGVGDICGGGLLAAQGPAASAAPPSSRKAQRGGKGAKAAATAAAAAPSVVAAAVASAEFPLAGLVLSRCFLADRHLATVAAQLEAVTTGEVPAASLAALLPHCVDLRCDGSDGQAVAAALARHLPPLPSACIPCPDGVWVHADTARRAVLAAKEAIVANAVRDVDIAAAEVRERLRRAIACPDLEDTDALEAAVAATAAALQPDIDAAVAEARRSHQQRAAAAAKGAQQDLAASTAELWAELWAAARSWPWVAQHVDPPTAAVVAKAMLHDVGRPLVSNVLHELAFDAPELRTWLDTKGGAECGAALPVAKLKEAVKVLRKEAQGPFTALIDLLGGTSVDALVEGLRGACADGSIPAAGLHPPNKKAEREAQQAATEAQRQVVQAGPPLTPSTAGDGFAAIVRLALMTQARVFVRVPGKATSALVLALQDDALSAALPLVVRQLAKKGDLTAAELATIEALRAC